MDGTNRYRDQARKTQVGESDINDKFRVIKILKEEFGLDGLTGEAIEIPNGYAQARYPDIMVKAYVPPLVIELNGERPHGNGDPIERMQNDFEKMCDYSKVPDIKVIAIYSAQTHGYERNSVIENLMIHGLVRKA